eukprot:gene24960-31361_t
MPDGLNFHAHFTFDQMKQTEREITHFITLGLVDPSFQINPPVFDEDLTRVCFIHSVTIEHQLSSVLQNPLDQIISSGLIRELRKVFVLNYGQLVPKYIQEQYEDYPQIHFIQVSVDITFAETPTLRILHAVSKHIQDKLTTFHVTDADKRNKRPDNLQVLYLHTKGVSYIQPNPRINDWTDMMLYFLVEQHESNRHLLASGKFDCIGVNYLSNSLPAETHSRVTSSPQVFDRHYDMLTSTHFSGNFWWATGEYLQSVNTLQYNETDKMQNRRNSEFWILNDTNRVASTPCSEDSVDLTCAGLVITRPVRVYCPHFSTVSHYQDEYPRSEYAEGEEEQKAREDE